MFHLCVLDYLSYNQADMGIIPPFFYRGPLCASFKAFNSKVKRTCPWEGGGDSPLKKGWWSCTQHKHLLSYSGDVLDFNTSSCLVFQKDFKRFFKSGDGGRKSFVAHSLHSEHQPKLSSLLRQTAQEPESSWITSGSHRPLSRLKEWLGSLWNSLIWFLQSRSKLEDWCHSFMVEYKASASSRLT